MKNANKENALSIPFVKEKGAKGIIQQRLKKKNAVRIAIDAVKSARELSMYTSEQYLMLD